MRGVVNSNALNYSIIIPGDVAFEVSVVLVEFVDAGVCLFALFGLLHLECRNTAKSKANNTFACMFCCE